MSEAEAQLERDPCPVPDRWQWFREKAQSKYAWWWLGFFSFFESSPVILPPTDMFLVPMLTFNRHRVVALVAFTTVTSALGGIAAYLTAALLFDLSTSLIAWARLTDEVAHAGDLLGRYTFLATFFTAATPFPYTPLAFAAGFLKVNFISFTAASLVGRFVRYGAVALIVHFFGVAVVPRLGRIATRTTLVAVLIALIIIALIAYALV